MNQKHIERIYDYYDRVADLLYHAYKKPYIEGMNEAFNLLLDDRCSGTYREEELAQMREWKAEILGDAFDREDIRKSVQLGMLKGYKHTNSSNEHITPDTIGIFIGYLIKKLYDEKPIERLFDPLVGSGNLIYAVANQLDQDVAVYGVDNDLVKCNLARNLGDLMDYKNEMFFQDTLSFHNVGFDVIVTDMPLASETVPYFPYAVLRHHVAALHDGGFCFAVIENDFFEQDDNASFKQDITETAHIFGLIKLPETLFQSNPKSILILRKKGPHIVPISDFLLVDLPSFSDLPGLEQTIAQIDSWIADRKDDLK